MNNKIQIAIPSDQNYYVGLLVTAFSIAEHANPGAELVFNILDGGIHDDSYDELVRTIKAIRPEADFRRFDVRQFDFSRFPKWSGNRMAYVRYMLPALLRDEEFVIYTDSDCLWQIDVVQLWALRDRTRTLQAVYDSYGDRLESAWYAKRGLEYRSKGCYFCSALLLMNIRLFNEQSIVERCSQFIVDHPDIMHADQSALNFVFGQTVKLLPYYWSIITRDIALFDKTSQYVLHYAGDMPIKKTKDYLSLPWCYLDWFETLARATGKGLRETCGNYGFNYNALRIWCINGILRRRYLRWALFAYLKLTGRGMELPWLRRCSVQFKQ